MLTYPSINPIAFHLGPLPVHWYGLMYLVGFLGAWGLLRLRAPAQGLNADQVSDIIFYAALGVILGGRLGYMLFYEFQEAIHDPFSILAVWQGGMSFHGGLLGVLVAMWFYARYLQKPFFELTDLIAPVVPIGLGAGRLGNFINGELWGRVTDVPWSMVFPMGGDMPRHPSQLYEFFLEGVVLFIILWLFSNKKRPSGAVSGLFLVCYGLFRFGAEFFRAPDWQIGFVAFGWMSKGQLLSLPMMVFGIILLIMAYGKRKGSCNNI